jgi:enoyl-CoA hydratase/carnithine racemase
MSFQEIRYEVEDHVLTITLNRPDRLNAFTPTMARELIEAFDRSDADDDVRAVIVTPAARSARARTSAGAAGRSTGATGTPATRACRATAADVSRCASTTRSSR